MNSITQYSAIPWQNPEFDEIVSKVWDLLTGNRFANHDLINKHVETLDMKIKDAHFMDGTYMVIQFREWIDYIESQGNSANQQTCH